MGVERERVVRADMHRTPGWGEVCVHGGDGTVHVPYVLEYVDGEDEIERSKIGGQLFDPDLEDRAPRSGELLVEGASRRVHDLETWPRRFDRGHVVAELGEKRREGADARTDLQDSTRLIQIVLEQVEAHVRLVEVDIELASCFRGVQTDVIGYAVRDSMSVEAADEVVEL